MKSKQNILDEILHQNRQLLKFDHYFNDTTNKKENIGEDKTCHNKLNHQQKKKKRLLKERTVLSKESQKKENKMHGTDQIYRWGFHDKKYNWYGNIKRKCYKDETSSRCYNY